MVTEEIIQDCIENPVRSVNHDFTPEQVAQYGSMFAKGRSLYDNLRTKCEIGHDEAFQISAECFGIRPRTR